MNDTTLPVLQSSVSTRSSNINTSDNDVFPFLVHSQDSMTNGEPPEVDNGKLTRQKRRRTSAEDQATLEAEYKRNPKPDKAARMAIVKQVSLGEKEVQIWFQNRRQNTRRKSRPLLPHEITAFGLGGMAALSSDAASSNARLSSQGTSPPLSSSQAEVLDSDQGQCHIPKEEALRRLHDISAPSLEAELEERVKSDLDSSQLATTPLNTLTCSQPSTERTESLAYSQPRSLSRPLQATLGYLSNRRNAPNSTQSTPTASQGPKFATTSSSHALQPALRPERITAYNSAPSSTQVRLSLSLDGKAELVSSEVSPPRPHRPRTSSSSSSVNHRRPVGLQRSHSALPFSHVPRKTSSSLPLIPQIPTGRSRDARTWEFCCDTDARDVLTTQAENESSGSAVAAISLLRSTSASTLKTNVNKRNAPAPKPDSGKRSKKPKLGRASSNFTKLQSTSKALRRSPSGDSDKENRVPQEGVGNPQSHNLPGERLQNLNCRLVLEESTTSLTHTASVGPRIARGISDLEIFEEHDEEKEVDQEVERFMRGEVSPSKKGDLDCIQGLLSLSQGSWR